MPEILGGDPEISAAFMAGTVNAYSCSSLVAPAQASETTCTRRPAVGFGVRRGQDAALGGRVH